MMLIVMICRRFRGVRFEGFDFSERTTNCLSGCSGLFLQNDIVSDKVEQSVM